MKVTDLAIGDHKNGKILHSSLAGSKNTFKTFQLQWSLNTNLLMQCAQCTHERVARAAFTPAIEYLWSAATNSQPQRYASHRGVWIRSRTETTHGDFGNRWTEDADWITAVTWARPTQSVPPPAKVCLNSIDANMSCHLTHTILHACPLTIYCSLSFC